MASASADNTLKMWDLRKLKDLMTYQFPESDIVPQSINFDYSGVYLIAAGDHIRYGGDRVHGVKTRLTSTQHISDSFSFCEYFLKFFFFLQDICH